MKTISKGNAKAIVFEDTLEMRDWARRILNGEFDNTTVISVDPADARLAGSLLVGTHADSVLKLPDGYRILFFGDISDCKKILEELKESGEPTKPLLKPHGEDWRLFDDQDNHGES